MPAMLRVIFADFWGLRRVGGFALAIRWLFAIAFNFRQCRAERNLQPADRAIGEGPFAVHMGDARAHVIGPQVLSGVREIWVRDVYLQRGLLTLPKQGTVVDLGANMGNFTLLALAQSPAVRVVSVEADARNLPLLQRQIDLNGWADRVTICPHFIGGQTHLQEDLLSHAVGNDGPTFLTEDEFIRRHDLRRIDFLKCDIEGSEFDLFKPGSALLAMTEQAAMEVHSVTGDVEAFIRLLDAEGFEVNVTRQGNDAIVQCKRKESRMK